MRLKMKNTLTLLTIVITFTFVMGGCTNSTSDVATNPLDPPQTKTVDAWNMVEIGSIDTDPDLPYSKLAPWPNTDDDRYLYSGCYVPYRAFMTVDVKDPTQPKRLATVFTYDPIESPPPPKEHPVWKDNKYNSLPIKTPCGDWKGYKPGDTVTPTGWDPGWNTHSHFVSQSGDILVANMERWRLGSSNRPNYHGIKVYDVSKPEKPEFLSYLEVPASDPHPKSGVYQDAIGAHHFHFDGRYVYMGSNYKGFIDRILVIVDLKDPKNPVEAGKWWIKGQKTPEEDAVRDWIPQSSFNDPIFPDPATGKLTKKVGLHYAAATKDRVYLSYHQAGLVILDIKDKSNPKLISRLDYHVPNYPDNPNSEKCIEQNGPDSACGNTHAAKLIPGRDLLWVTDEYFNCPYGHLRFVDISDEKNPKIISNFLYDVNLDCGAEWPARTPSTHIGNAFNKNLLFMAWYGYGVRAIDISDPYNPVETGHYNYEISEDIKGSECYDVIFGPGRYLYVSDSKAGLRVLKYTGPWLD
jgi:hypothetical protein